MLYGYMEEMLDKLGQNNNLRRIPEIEHDGNYIVQAGEGRRMLNMSSNDYLGLSSDKELKDGFFSVMDKDSLFFGSTSSRLLTGNSQVMTDVECWLAAAYNREAALVFNSGYHANVGILPAVSDSATLILADKLVHASIIDGIRLCQAKTVRFRHNDYEQLERLVSENAGRFSRIIIVTESIFSMDGDIADLRRLTSLKRKYDNVMLYVDEAHAFGVRGEKGLGIAEEQGVVADIDFLVGTFGKAVCSMGAFVVCDSIVARYLVNRMRTLIFTTALPPVCWQWTLYVLQKMQEMAGRRSALERLWKKFSAVVPGVESHIVPVVLGSSEKAVLVASELRRRGFYVLPVRPPTVPEGTSRLRISLTAGMAESDIDEFIVSLNAVRNETEVH